MSEGVADVLRKLTIVFAEFEGRLEQTPLIRKLTRGRFELAKETEPGKSCFGGARWQAPAMRT